MKIQIIQVPYDSGYKNARQGRGPGQFIQNNIQSKLKAVGHDVLLQAIKSQSDFTTEVTTAFELDRLLDWPFSSYAI